MLGGGGGEPGGMLRSSLKRIVSTGALAGGTRGPSLAPSRLHRAPRSHPLPRVASFGSDASLDSLAASTPRGDLQVGIQA